MASVNLWMPILLVLPSDWKIKKAYPSTHMLKECGQRWRIHSNCIAASGKLNRCSEGYIALRLLRSPIHNPRSDIGYISDIIPCVSDR